MDTHPQLSRKVQAYQMPETARELILKNKPLLLAGISAAGKTSIAKQLAAKGIGRQVIAHTTRAPRNTEKNGENYWFVSEAEMLELVDQQAFIEVKIIHEESCYGTSISSYKKVVEEGKQPVLLIDVQGIDELTKVIPGLRAKFLLPPDAEEWLHRLGKREIMTSVDQHRRTVSARQEIEKVLLSNYYDIIINRDIDEAAEEIAHGSNVMSQQNQEIARNLLDSISNY